MQIDAPEADEGECYAAEASAALALILSREPEIRLEADPRLDDVDRFGRLLRYIRREDTNVNLELVERARRRSGSSRRPAATPTSCSTPPAAPKPPGAASGAPARAELDPDTGSTPTAVDGVE